MQMYRARFCRPVESVRFVCSVCVNLANGHLTSSNSAAVLKAIVTDETLDYAGSTGEYFRLEKLGSLRRPRAREIIAGDILPAAPPSHSLLANCSVGPFHLGRMWRRISLGNLRLSQIRSDRAKSLLAHGCRVHVGASVVVVQENRVNRGEVVAERVEEKMPQCQHDTVLRFLVAARYHPLWRAVVMFSLGELPNLTGDSGLAIPFFNTSSHSSRRPSPSGSKLVASNGCGVGHAAREMRAADGSWEETLANAPALTRHEDSIRPVLDASVYV